MSALDPARRQQLLETVATWLDDLAVAEPAPPGVASEVLEGTAPAPDLFSLLAQLAALTRETQLQGRATNRLHTELSARLDAMAASQLTPETLSRSLGDVRREARLEVLSELLEVRDRLNRGIDEAQRRLESMHGIWARFASREVLTALLEGNAMARERLDDLLRRLDVQEIPCLGRPFDPTFMRAVEVGQNSSVPPDTVLDVFRPGYISGGRVLRFAEVRVAAARRDSGTPQGSEHG
ncbi:MAG: nucleotide exchange factor GrpE [Candidatus Tectimicrobiota bacterium]